MSLTFRSTAFSLVALMTPAMAIASEVNIYSYREPELVAPIFDAFTAETGIKVNVAFLKKGMLEKLKAEGKRSPADVVLTVDISRLTNIVASGVTQPITSDKITATIPAEFRDPAGHWFGITSRARVIYASKDRVADGEVTTYENLTDPKWKGRICTRSGTSAYNLALTSAVIANHGEEAAKSWLSGVKDNLARKPQGNDRAQVKAIFAGECDIAVGNTYYMKQMLENEEQKQWADSVRIVFPTFENGGTHVNLSGIAMAKHAPNQENALALMEFLVGETAQGIYAAANGEYPLNAAVPADPLVASWGSFTADDTPLIDIANLRSHALKLTEIVDFDE